MNDTTLRLTERAVSGVTAMMALARSTSWG
jgi:hypothetical protein